MNGILQRSARRHVVASVTRPVTIQTASYCSPTVPCQLAMKVGTVLPGLDLSSTQMKSYESAIRVSDWVDSLLHMSLAICDDRRREPIGEGAIFEIVATAGNEQKNRRQESN
jgi:hypothetical protein